MQGAKRDHAIHNGTKCSKFHVAKSRTNPRLQRAQLTLEWPCPQSRSNRHPLTHDMAAHALHRQRQKQLSNPHPLKNDMATHALHRQRQTGCRKTYISSSKGPQSMIPLTSSVTELSNIVLHSETQKLITCFAFRLDTAL